LTQPIDLHWQASVPASCFHAAETLQRWPAVVEPALHAAITRPAEELQRALREEHIVPEVFWSHVIPLAADNRGMKELGAVTLTKVLGRNEVPTRLLCFQGLLTDLMRAFTVALPDLPPTLAACIEPFRRRWQDHGRALLAGVARWTEPEVLVAEATVVFVHPTRGGGGNAHLPYNLARIEAVRADPVPELPEVLRLAWLLSMLNLDMPRYSDGITPHRLTTVAGLAMMPVVLSAAEGVGLSKYDEETLALAFRAWLPPDDAPEAWRTTVQQWWDVFRTMRLPWPEALKALDRLLVEGEGLRR
jgi:hypothetical protein